jgi:hypothetical protein
VKKSEMIRQAAVSVRRFGRREDERVCYCTPTRNMVRSLKEVTLNEFNTDSHFEWRAALRDMSTAVAEKVKEITGRTYTQSLNSLDEDRGLDDEAVAEAFEKTALMYEERGE